MKYFKNLVLLTFLGLQLLLFQACSLEGDGASFTEELYLGDIYIEATTTEAFEHESTISVTVYNNTTTDIKGWTISGDVTFTVLDIWDAIVDSTGSSLIIKNETWTEDLLAGGSVTFGFRCSDKLSSDSILNCRLNDIPCDVIIDGVQNQN